MLCEMGSTVSITHERLSTDYLENLAFVLAQRIRQTWRRIWLLAPGCVTGVSVELLSTSLADILNAGELQFWKEFDGIFTADPRRVSTARLLPTISPAELVELSHYGMELVHPSVAEQVCNKVF